MSIKDNFSDFLRRYQEVQELSVSDFARELDIAKSALEIYLKGSGNPRLDTLEHLAEKCGVTAAEIISDPLPGQEQSEIIIQAAKEFADLPPERRERGLQLFHDLMELFAERGQI